MINETEFVEAIKILMEINLALVQQIHALGAALIEHGIATPQELGKNLQAVQGRTQYILEKIRKSPGIDLPDILKDFQGPIQ